MNEALTRAIQDLVRAHGFAAVGDAFFELATQRAHDGAGKDDGAQALLRDFARAIEQARGWAELSGARSGE